MMTALLFGVLVATVDELVGMCVTRWWERRKDGR